MVKLTAGWIKISKFSIDSQEKLRRLQEVFLISLDAFYHRMTEQSKLEGTSKDLLTQYFVGKEASVRLSSTLFNHILKNSSDEVTSIWSSPEMTISSLEITSILCTAYSKKIQWESPAVSLARKNVAFLQDHEAREHSQRWFWSVKSPENEGSKDIGLEQSKGVWDMYTEPVLERHTLNSYPRWVPSCLLVWVFLFVFCLLELFNCA